MKVILKEDDEAYSFLKNEIMFLVKSAIKEVLTEAASIEKEEPEDEWCNTKRAQEILKVKATKMQEIRDNSPHNGIKMSKYGKAYRYYIPSLYQYIENKVIH